MERVANDTVSNSVKANIVDLFININKAVFRRSRIPELNNLDKMSFGNQSLVHHSTL
jgi:hypothetical protein